jgi:hypothetical protein
MSPTPATYQPCDLRQVTLPLSAMLSSTYEYLQVSLVAFLLKDLTHFILQQLYKAGTTTPILQLKELRHRTVTDLSFGHMKRK